MKKYTVAVLGATGAVGVEMIKTLEKRNFPVANLKLLASARSAGKTATFKGENIFWLGNNTNNRFVTADIVANVANILVGKTLTNLAKMYFLASINKSIGKFLSPFGWLV